VAPTYLVGMAVILRCPAASLTPNL